MVIRAESINVFLAQGRGYSNIKMYGDVPSNESLFCKKSLNMGLIFYKKKKKP